MHLYEVSEPKTRDRQPLRGISGCQKLCEREADCRYFSYNEGGVKGNGK